MGNSKILVLGSLISLAFMGCGAGNGIISNVAFTNSVINGDLSVGIDATMSAGGLVLPDVALPIYNPQNPSQLLGELQTSGAHIIVQLDATQALKLPGMIDGTKLPSGSAIPVSLPQGMSPIAIPVFNSNSLVYLAVNGQEVMLGVAVSILKEDNLNLPLNVFLPFTISPEIHGIGGFFLGAKQGVAVFAINQPGALPAVTPSVTSAPTIASTILSKFSSLGSAQSGGIVPLAATSAATSVSAPAAPIQVISAPLTSSKIRRLQRTWNSIDQVQID